MPRAGRSGFLRVWGASPRKMSAEADRARMAGPGCPRMSAEDRPRGLTRLVTALFLDLSGGGWVGLIRSGYLRGSGRGAGASPGGIGPGRPAAKRAAQAARGDVPHYLRKRPGRARAAAHGWARGGPRAQGTKGHGCPGPGASATRPGGPGRVDQRALVTDARAPKIWLGQAIIFCPILGGWVGLILCPGRA